MGSVVLPHLVTGWHVDQAIMSEEERLVIIRFGRDWDPDCMRQDEVLYRIADRVKNFAVIYVCDLDQVPDFKQMYELYDPVTIMFFFRNKHMMCDFGTGNNNKLNWVLEDKQELIDIIETIYRGAKKGRGLVVSPKDLILLRDLLTSWLNGSLNKDSTSEDFWRKGRCWMLVDLNRKDHYNLDCDSASRHDDNHSSSRNIFPQSSITTQFNRVCISHRQGSKLLLLRRPVPATPITRYISLSPSTKSGDEADEKENDVSTQDQPPIELVDISSDSEPDSEDENMSSVADYTDVEEEDIEPPYVQSDKESFADIGDSDENKSSTPEFSESEPESLVFRDNLSDAWDADLNPTFHNRMSRVKMVAVSQVVKISPPEKSSFHYYTPDPLIPLQENCDYFEAEIAGLEEEIRRAEEQLTEMRKKQHKAMQEKSPDLYRLVEASAREKNKEARHMLASLPDKSSSFKGGWFFNYKYEPELSNEEVISQHWRFRSAHKIDEPTPTALKRKRE
ncbi:hypothetical protein G7Y89_g11599 [Cudoniella acicularis]|uniref:Thioredoxin-like protein 4A n=1 Tax=Cudoniella acicularis TaxID=354080 RepID=A0A8H4W0I1_9HELO|nr:hypothetical protein G7Y89_g11599 [Cudoniella acicularis]